jgi:S-adenosylmethionine uptake transporter
VSRPSPAIAFAAATGGIALFSCMDAVMKGLVLAIGIMPTVLWRGVAAVVLSGGLFLCVRRRPQGWAGWRLHGARGGITAAMSVLFFWGLAQVPMAQAVALCFVAPIAAIFLAAATLGERLDARVLAAAAVAAAGVGVIALGQSAQQPAGGSVRLGTLAVLASALIYAVNIVLMRAQSQRAGPVEIAFYQNLVMTGTLWLAAPVVGTGLPDATHWPALIGAAALATGSLLLLAWAYAHAPASYLAASEYTSFAWAALLGFMVFGERVSVYTLAGAALIVAGSIVAARRAAGPPVEEGL